MPRPGQEHKSEYQRHVSAMKVTAVKAPRFRGANHAGTSQGNRSRYCQRYLTLVEEPRRKERGPVRRRRSPRPKGSQYVTWLGVPAPSHGDAPLSPNGASHFDRANGCEPPQEPRPQFIERGYRKADDFYGIFEWRSLINYRAD